VICEGKYNPFWMVKPLEWCHGLPARAYWLQIREGDSAKKHEDPCAKKHEDPCAKKPIRPGLEDVERGQCMWESRPKRWFCCSCVPRHCDGNEVPGKAGDGDRMASLYSRHVLRGRLRGIRRIRRRSKVDQISMGHQFKGRGSLPAQSDTEISIEELKSRPGVSILSLLL